MRKKEKEFSYVGLNLIQWTPTRNFFLNLEFIVRLYSDQMGKKGL